MKELSEVRLERSIQASIKQVVQHPEMARFLSIIINQYCPTRRSEITKDLISEINERYGENKEMLNHVHQVLKEHYQFD